MQIDYDLISEQLRQKFTKMMHVENNIDRLVKKHNYVESEIAKNLRRCKNTANLNRNAHREEMISTYQTFDEINENHSEAVEVLNDFKAPLHRCSHRAKLMHKVKYTPVWKTLRDFNLRVKNKRYGEEGGEGGLGGRHSTGEQGYTTDGWAE